MQTITTIGFDIAKSVFQVHCVDAEGKVILRRQLKRRSDIGGLFASFHALYRQTAVLHLAGATFVLSPKSLALIRFYRTGR